MDDDYDDYDFWDYEPSDYDTVATDDGGQFDAENGYDSGTGDDTPATDPNDTPAYDPYGTDYDNGAGYGTDDYPLTGTPGTDEFTQDQGYLYTDAAGNDFYADGTIGLPDGSYVLPDGSYELSDGSTIATNGDYTDAQGNEWVNLGFAGAPNLYQDNNGDVWNATTGEVTIGQQVDSPYQQPGTAPATTGSSSGGASSGGSKSGGGGGSGGGGTSLKLPTTTPKAGTSASGGSAPAKTIVADQRIGNDRYIVYSDGSTQRLSNYYTAANGAGATTKETTVGGVLNDLFSTAGKVIGAVVAPTTVANAPKLPAGTTSATAITGLNKPPGGANPTVPTIKPVTVASTTSSQSAGLLVLAALAAKVFIFH